MSRQPLQPFGDIPFAIPMSTCLRIGYLCGMQVNNEAVL